MSVEALKLSDKEAEALTIEHPFVRDRMAVRDHIFTGK
jgi:hypothetical protein